MGVLSFVKMTYNTVMFIYSAANSQENVHGHEHMGEIKTKEWHRNFEFLSVYVANSKCT